MAQIIHVYMCYEECALHATDEADNLDELEKIIVEKKLFVIVPIPHLIQTLGSRESYGIDSISHPAASRKSLTPLLNQQLIA